MHTLQSEEDGRKVGMEENSVSSFAKSVKNRCRNQGPYGGSSAVALTDTAEGDATVIIRIKVGNGISK